MEYKLTHFVAGDISITSRNNNFEFMRLLLAVIVIWAHSDMLLTGSGSTDFFNHMVHGQLFSGSLAVFGFFTISGFLISQSWQLSKNAKDYFSKRIRRIYPGFIVASLVTAFIFAPLGADSLREYWHGFPNVLGKYLLNVCLLLEPYIPPTFSHNPIHLPNGSLWSIQPEFLCYVIVAVLGVAGLLKRRPLVVAFAACVLMAYWFNTLYFRNRLQWAPGALSIPLHMWLADLAYFCMGMVAAQFLQCRITDRTVLTALLLTIVASQIPHGFLIVLPFTLPILLLWVAYTPRLSMQNWAKDKGDFSYGLYLYAYPIQQLLIKYVPVLRHAFLLFFMSLLLTTLCAIKLAVDRSAVFAAPRSKNCKGLKLPLLPQAGDA